MVDLDAAMELLAESPEPRLDTAMELVAAPEPEVYPTGGEYGEEYGDEAVEEITLESVGMLMGMIGSQDEEARDEALSAVEDLVLIADLTIREEEGVAVVALRDLTQEGLLHRVVHHRPATRAEALNIAERLSEIEVISGSRLIKELTRVTCEGDHVKHINGARLIERRSERVLGEEERLA